MLRINNNVFTISSLDAARGVATARKPIFQPARLPTIRGTFARHALTPQGNGDGSLLADGHEVPATPFLLRTVVSALVAMTLVVLLGLGWIIAQNWMQTGLDRAAGVVTTAWSVGR